MRWTMIVLGVALAAGSAWAQEEKKADRFRQFAEKAREQMITKATERYKLSESQVTQLKTLLEERSKITDAKREEIGKAFREAGAGGGRPDFKAVREKLQPLFEEMRKFAMETADKVKSDILNDEQKKLFDEDVAAGRQIIGGGFGGQGGFGQGGPGGRGFTGRGFQEQQWDGYAQGVIRLAKTSEEQTGKINEMLKLAKEAAAEYRKAKEKELAEVAKELADLRQNRDTTREQRAAVEKKATDLNAPIGEIFSKFQKDVQALLTEEQRKLIEPLNRTGGRRPAPPAAQ